MLAGLAFALPCSANLLRGITGIHLSCQAGIAILTVGTAAVFVAVKAGLSPHEHFKRTAAAVRKVHCGCTSFQIWAEKTP